MFDKHGFPRSGTRRHLREGNQPVCKQASEPLSAIPSNYTFRCDGGSASVPMFTVRGIRELCEFTQKVLECRHIISGLRKRAGRERQRFGNRQSLIIEQFWRKVPRRSQLCSLVAVSGRSRRLLQGKSRSLEAVPVDAQLSYFGFKCLSWNSQLNGGAGWTPNHAFGFPECGFEHFFFVLGKVSNERNRRHS